MMNMMVSIKEGVDLIIHSAGILDGWSAMSYEKFVMDLEIIRMVEYVVQGLSLTDNDLALDAICEVGSGRTVSHSPAHPEKLPTECLGPNHRFIRC